MGSTFVGWRARVEQAWREGHLADRWFDRPELEEDAGDEEYELDPSPETAGREFVDLLIYLNLSGKLDAGKVCTMAWWAANAGIVGPAKDIGKRPGRPSGHYRRHLDAKLGFKAATDKQAILRVPGWAPHSAKRVEHEIAVFPGHETLAKPSAVCPR